MVSKPRLALLLASNLPAQCKLLGATRKTPAHQPRDELKSRTSLGRKKRAAQLANPLFGASD
jgi:hypothetical protein